MKNILLTTFFGLLSFYVYAQTTIPYTGLLAQPQSIDTDGNTSSAIFDVSDLSGKFDGNSVTSTNYVFWQDCKRYPIDTVFATSTEQVFLRVLHDGNSAPITRVGTIIEESPQGIGHIIAGLLPSQNQCIASYYAQFIGTGSGSGGADTLYLSNGTMLVNGDTIPNLSCSTERIVGPFDFSDRVVVSTVVIDTFEFLDVFVNGVYFNQNAYSISVDSLIFNTYTIQSGDEIFIRSCQSVVSSGAPNINQVLSSGNNAGGALIKNIGDPVDGQDAVTLSYFEANSGGDDTLYLSDGTMLVNGDTIPVFDCSSQRFFAPFAQSDRIIVASGTIDTFELINLFINGVHYEQATYTISEDSIIFNDYTLSSSDTVSLDVCSVGVGSAASTTLNAVLSNSNDGGGLVIKNIGTPVDNNDVVTKQYFENNDKWLATELANGTVVIDAQNNSFFMDTLNLLRFSSKDGLAADYEFILSSGISIPLRIARFEGSDTVSLEMFNSRMILKDSTGEYFLSDLADLGISTFFYQDGVSITNGDTLSSFVKAGAIETVQNTNFTASLGIVNIVNTTSTAIQVTPPASPSIGDCFAVVDGTGNGSNNNITVDFSGSGENFHSASQNYVMNLDNDFAEFLYVGSTVGWIRKK